MRILLVVMVKNEEKALPRLLLSAAGVVDGVVVTDTGSSDRTIAVARAVCEAVGLPIDVFEIPWQDFGTCRSANIAHAREVAGGNPDTHLLLLDADMEIPAGTKRPEQLPPVAMLPQRHGTSVWHNVRVIRADVSARYVRRTHEYIEHDDWVATPVRNWFTIIDHCDGGCRADKFERDERLLRLDLAELNDTRSRFYLAQTLQNMGRKREAITLYDERARVEDFPEEAWAARLEASRCSDGADADMRALEAYFTRPQRIEPITDMAVRAADSGRHRLALGLADLVRGHRVPDGEILYCDAAVYRWRVPYVDMVSSFYVGALDSGRRACDFLHLTRGSPHAHNALENARFYAVPLPGARRALPFTPPPGFAPMNPSLYPRDRGGWWAIIRTVNYRIDDRGCYRTADGAYFDQNTPVITRNFLVSYDTDLTEAGPIRELVAPPPPIAGARIRGFEDLRFVGMGVYTGDLVTAGVRLDANAAGVPEFWEAVWDYGTGELRSCRRLSAEGKCEKNWLPHGFGLGAYLYGHDPITIVDRDGAVCHRAHCTLDLSAFRGSASPIDFFGGHLHLIHEVSTPGGGKRVYLHRFVFTQGEDIYVSPAFTLRSSPCIECCFSISNVDEGVLMACSWEDREIYTITVPREWFEGLGQAWTHGRVRPIA